MYKRAPYVAQASLELVILPPQLSNTSDYRYKPYSMSSFSKCLFTTFPVKAMHFYPGYEDMRYMLVLPVQNYVAQRILRTAP